MTSKMVSLFAGIGGFELAFKKVGVETSLMCEIDPIAKQVLKANLPNIPIVDDVCSLKSIPQDVEILCAGFPCQDLSSVGVKKGLSGHRSSLIREVFRLLRKKRVEWVLLENVSFMLRLNQGETIQTIVNELENLGYKWAYRTIDSISFVPQHRCRVFIVASLHNDPRNVILSNDSLKSLEKPDLENFSQALGFYWTEGRYALGLTLNALPTLKSGSTIGIPSPPAIAFPNGEISIPDVRDAERLQGFPRNWTLPAEKIAKSSSRWKLIGNAVTVDVVSWIARKMFNPQEYDYQNDEEMLNGSIWPKAAWGGNGKRYISNASTIPIWKKKVNLQDFLKFPRKKLSLKASLGFKNRLEKGNMHCPDYFRDALDNHIKMMENIK